MRVEVWPLLRIKGFPSRWLNRTKASMPMRVTAKNRRMRRVELRVPGKRWGRFSEARLKSRQQNRPATAVQTEPLRITKYHSTSPSRKARRSRLRL